MAEAIVSLACVVALPVSLWVFALCIRSVLAGAAEGHMAAMDELRRQIELGRALTAEMMTAHQQQLDGILRHLEDADQVGGQPVGLQKHAAELLHGQQERERALQHQWQMAQLEAKERAHKDEVARQQREMEIRLAREQVADAPH